MTFDTRQLRNLLRRLEEWRRPSLAWVAGLLLLETLTGLSIYLLPFSVPNQVMVILHTLAGLGFVLPFLWYQLRHWLLYRPLALSHVKLTGYLAMAAVLTAIVSGLVLTAQAIWGSRISYGWDLVHVVATFGVLAFLTPHLLVLVLRAARARQSDTARRLLLAQRGFAVRASLVAGGGFAIVAVGALAYRPAELHNALPADYSYVYGPDRPFAPSLARTSTGGAFDARSLGGSEGCGTRGCHEQIYTEWAVSAHRYSAMDPAFQAVQKVMAEQNSPESTRYCGGCHDPISLFSGTKNVFVENLTGLVGYQEGVSCIVCHSIKETDVKGNAAYVITQPQRYMFELESGEQMRPLRDFLIRAYPRHHVKSLQHKLFKSPEFCAACHKQFIDEEINQVGWVQLQNQYDNWRKSRWNDTLDPHKTIECRECHMPLVDSQDPARGDDLDYNRTPGDRKHRRHRFVGANQMMPLLLQLPGAEEQVRLTEKWLRGELEIPEIAHKWRDGPAVTLRLVAPDTARPGEAVRVHVLVTNNKVGHDFPTGPLDIIQAWIELVVQDQDGNVVFESGQRDARHFIAPGSFLFKAEPVDVYGNLIDRHNLWEMVGVRYRRALFPGLSDRAEFRFTVPEAVAAVDGEGKDSQDRPSVKGPALLHVSAKLMYRKINQSLINFLFGEHSGLTAPVTVMSEDSRTVVVTSRSSSPAGP